MNDEALLRYSRHILLPEIDVEGQSKLNAARVLIIGMGGLGSPIGLYLAAAGVGNITIVDDDLVEISNLQRQIAHHSGNVGESKVESAAAKMRGMNPLIEVTCISHRLSAEEMNQQVINSDLVVDATDNFATRALINRACTANQKPAVFGAAVRLEGQLFIYDPAQQDAPCYECLHPTINDAALNCADSGVAGPIVGIIGTMEAMEAIRLICGIGRTTAGILQTFDARDMQWHQFKVLKRADCAGCE